MPIVAVLREQLRAVRSESDPEMFRFGSSHRMRILEPMPWQIGMPRRNLSPAGYALEARAALFDIVRIRKAQARVMLQRGRVSSLRRALEEGPICPS